MSKKHKEEKRKVITELELKDEKIRALEKKVDELSNMLIKCYVGMRVEGSYIKDMLIGSKPHFTEEDKKKLAVRSAERLVNVGTDIRNRYWMMMHI